MKKIVGIILSVAMCLSCFSLTACGAPRNEILKIYNWEGYMDEQVIADFPAWYAEATGGKKIKLDIATFENTEDVLTVIDVQKADFDLACPSEYIVDRMIKKNLLKPIDKTIVDMNLLDEDVLALMDSIDSERKYNVPYMMGTFGIMYDSNKITTNEADMQSWNSMFDSKYKGKFTVKDSVRDSFAMANIYNNKDALATASANFTNYDAPTYRSKLDSLFADTSDATISAVKTTLLAQKALQPLYESDSGKDEMAAGHPSTPAFGFYWSCDAGFAMNSNQNIRYQVPKEGSNVYVDTFVIPATAGNPTAANYFLKYLLTENVSKLNMAYAGAATPVKSGFEAYRQEVVASTKADWQGIEATDFEAFKANYIETAFPSKTTLKRCSIMKDFGDKAVNLDEMWASVRA